MQELDQKMRAYLDRELCEAAGIGKPMPAAPAAVPQVDGIDHGKLQADILDMTSKALGIPIETLDAEENLANYGMDSIAITEVMAQISRTLDISIAPTTFFEAKNLAQLCSILEDRYPKAIEARYQHHTVEPVSQPAVSESDVANWLKDYQQAFQPKPKAVKATAPEAASQAVAVISMAGKFPGCPDLKTFAQALAEGRDCISEVPADRWDWRAVYGDPKKGAFTDVKYGGFIDDIAAFDAEFFNISRKEAELTDPQHRLFIQAVWQLLESGGYAPKSLSGKKVSIFLGINLQDYAHLVTDSGSVEPVQLAGLGHMFCPNRLSFLLDVQGPSQVIDTACSSSLAAVHRGVMSILHENCEMAIAGGSNLLISPLQHILFSRVGMICPDGRCKTFGAAANGYVRSDGVGAVLLKRLDLAERDGDTILGVIRASGENHGGTATSLTAPNQKAQADLIADVQRQGDIDPRTIGLMECHGTGTPLGDPIEVEGLTQAFQKRYTDLGLEPAQQAYCGLGSVKSNIGHCETAAGVAGLIKLLCALQSKQQYRSLHCETRNPNISLEGTPFYILDQPRDWPQLQVDGQPVPRRAGLSSFGAGGANVHLILEEYEASGPRAAVPGPFVFVLSAKKESVLRRYAANLAADLRSRESATVLADLAYTLQTGRDAYKVRFACVADSLAQLLTQLDAFAAGQPGDYQTRQLRKRNLQAAETVNQPQTMTAAALAAAWINGSAVAWQACYAAGSMKRMSTATYPFEATRHWLPEAEVEQGFALQAVAEDMFEVTLRERAFYLDDHRVNGAAVLPGVAYAEVMLKAAQAAGIVARGLKKLVWLAPIQVAGEQTIRVQVLRGANPSVQVLGSSAQQVHARAALDLESAEAEQSISLPDLSVGEWQTFDADRIYAAFDALGLAYGAGHRGVQCVHRRDDHATLREVWGQIQLPTVLQAAQGAFGLHPSLMDAALQCAIGLVLEDGGLPSETALPFAVDAIVQHATLPERMWVCIQQPKDQAGQTTKSDLTLCDEKGHVVVTLKGFATRRIAVPAPTRSKFETLLYTPTWHALELPHTGAAPSLTFTVDVDLNGVALDLQGQHHADQYDSLVCQLLLHFKEKLPHTKGTLQLVIGAAQDKPWAVGLQGLLRTVEAEFPGVRCQLVLVETGSKFDADLAHRLGSSPHKVLQVAPDGISYLSTQALPAVQASESVLREAGTYVITGGLGALGRLFAQHIAAQVRQANLVLLGRSPLNSAGEGFLQALEQAGAMASYRQVDLNDAAAVGEVIAQLYAEYGAIHGAIHAAGCLRDDYLVNKSLDQWRAVAQAKVGGTQHLLAALEDVNCDFALLFSSLSSWFGNPGQADYAAANGYMDASAQTWRGTMCVRSLNWPLWQNGRMKMDDATIAAMRHKTGLVPLPDQAGLAIAFAGLQQPAPQVIALYGDAAKMRAMMQPHKLAEPLSMVQEGHDHEALDRALQRYLAKQVSQLLKVDADIIESEEELTEYGFDSITFTEFTTHLNEVFGLDLMPTIFFQQPTIESFSSYMAADHSAAVAKTLGIAPKASQPAPKVQKPQPQPVFVAQATPPTTDGVAIIGVSGVFPKAANLDQFWQNLLSGRDCIDQPAAWRFSDADRAWIGAAGFVESIADFDPSFFGISPAEAKMMDPQQRLLLQQAALAIEDAGYAVKALAGSDLGIFVGTADTGYSHLLDRANTEVEAYFGTALAPSLGPNRMSYWLDVHGPSEAIETACSSALVAVHRAVESIRNGQCSAALVGGINTLLLPETFASFRKAGMIGDGHRCRTFSANADGYVRGEGAGVVMLKRLEDAHQDGDQIYAVIRGSAVNHGGRASSLTAPNPKAQAQLLRKAYAQTGVAPSSVSYIEAHGTGTPLGDPIEVEALKQVFQEHGAAAKSVGLGSVKSNIGHLEIASGMAGLLKLVLQMKHRKLVASLNATPINPMLKVENSPFYIVEQNRDWQPLQGAPLRAGVSSFGFGGSNAHVVLESYVAPERSETAVIEPLPILLSAKSAAALQVKATDLLKHLDQAPQLAFTDVAFTLAVGRDAMPHRLAFRASSKSELRQKLKQFAQDPNGSSFYVAHIQQHREALAPLRQDTEFAALALSWLSNGKADKTLQLWTRGLDLNFQSLFASHNPKRVSLPGYPFENKRYWPGVNEREAPFAKMAREEVAEVAPVEAADAPEYAYYLVAKLAAETLQMDVADFDPHVRLNDYGFDSITLVGYTERLNDQLGLDLSPADLFDYTNLGELSAGLQARYPDAFAQMVTPEPPAAMPEVATTDDTLVWATPVWQAAPLSNKPVSPTERHTLLFGVPANTAELAGTVTEQSLSAAAPATAFANCASLLLKALLQKTHRLIQVAVPQGHAACLEGLSGMLKTATLEQPNLRTQLVILDAQTADLASILNREAGQQEALVRYVDGQRQIATIKPMVDTREEKALYPHGLYVITGGAGGLGLAFAQWLRHEAPAAALVALGRSQPSQTQQEQLARLDVTFERIDLCDSAALNAFIESLHCEYGQIDGLIHAAGVIEDGALAQKSATSLHRVLEPKVTGLINLLEACNGTEPKHLILCSSLTALYGNPGQADYAAANGFMAALAARRNAAGKKTSVIHWPFWQSGGMQMDESHLAQMRQNSGLSPLPEAQGLAALGRVMRTKLPEVAVFYGDSAIIREKLLDAASEAQPTPNSSQAMPEKAAATSQDDIAIVGMSGSFPDAPDLETFWQNLLAGRHCIREIPQDRWDWRAIYGDPKSARNRSNVKWAGFIDGLHDFDPLFFGISPAEAVAMDPQQRLLLTHVWQALEHAGHAPNSLAGSRTGVFMAITGTSLLDKANQAVDDYSATGSVSSIGPNRISYLLDLHGPSEPVETACSSTLVALHRAVAAIRAGECEQAIVGGVNLLTAPEVHISFNKAGMLAEDGRCKTFSKDANGYVRGEGVGVVFIRKASTAAKDGDHVLALVKATAVNHGGRAMSLTAPNADAQTALLTEAYAKAKIDPESISYIEAHGTGTALGDPIEITGLKRAFKGSQRKTAIGAVKSNIGHLELSAGIAGLIKVILQMQHKTLVPTLFASPRNPHIKLEGSPFFIVEESQAWQVPASAPRRAGVSSFGFGGVNAHVVLEEAPPRHVVESPSERPLIWLLSAKDADGLQRRVAQLVEALVHADDKDVASIVYTLQVGRDALSSRLAFVASSLKAAQQKLRQFPEGETRELWISATQTKAHFTKTDALLADYRETGDAQPLLQAWCEGANVDWQALYGEKHPLRVPLPTYPFEMMDMRTGQQSMKVPPAPAKPGVTLVQPDAFYVRDHVVAGQQILPGALTVELARQAVGGNVRLEQVVWRTPVRMPQETLELQTSIAQNRVRVTSTDGDKDVVHLEATVSEQRVNPKESLDIAELPIKLAAMETLDVARVYTGFTAAGINYGPSHRVLTQLHMQGESVWAQLECAAANQHTLSDWLLHPAMLDGAFQACAALYQDGAQKSLFIPYAIEALETLAACSATMWVHLQRTLDKPDMQQWDMALYRADGAPAAMIHGFTLRPFQQGKPQPQKQISQPEDALVFFTAQFAEVSGVPVSKLQPHKALEDYGFDSMMVTRMTDRLEGFFGKLSRTLMFEFRNLAEMTAHFQQHHAAKLKQQLASRAPAMPVGTPVIAAKPKPRPQRAQTQDAPIAIVGLAGRYPQAADLQAFWQNLVAAKDCVIEVPQDRWDHARFFSPEKGLQGKTYSKWGGFVDGHDQFDPLFFNISPREAAYMDPQERLFLQTAWATLEDAGYTRASLTADVGVFVGVMYSEYQLFGVAQTAAGGSELALPSHPASIANRVSYFCNFQGPSIALDTMCSSSLTTIHLACNSIRNSECSAAIAGGVNLNLHPNKFLTLAQGRFASSAGRCGSFGDGGDGYVPAEGVGAVLLKPLAQAEADGDHIYAVVRGTALNHGGKTNGYSVPDPNAQAAVIRSAFERAKVDPASVSYIEAHGTGTALGDPIEISGLSKVMGNRNDDGKIAIGSVKSNIGHAESAAGIAGLTKVLLQMKHQQLVPSLHADVLNPNIDFAATPFQVQRQLSPWVSAGPRMASVSSFGAGGANAHVIVEDYERDLPTVAVEKPLVFPLSARQERSLKAVAAALLEQLQQMEDHALPHAAYSLQVGREIFEARAVVIAKDQRELVAGLQHIAAAGVHSASISAGNDPAIDAAIQAFMRGEQPDWRTLYPVDAQLCRISLPTYAFDEQRYWAPEPLPIHEGAALPLMLQPTWSPLPSQLPATNGTRHVIACEMRCDDPNWTYLCHPAADQIESRFEFYATRLLEEIQGLAQRKQPQALQVMVPAGTDAQPLTGLAGLLRTAAQEFEQLRIALLEVPSNGDARALAQQCQPQQQFLHIAWRDDKPCSKQYTPISPAGSAKPWKDGGTYLITGGAGGLGLLFAHEIAQAAKDVTLILSGRSPLKAERKSQLKKVAAKVHYVQLDVSDALATEAAIQNMLQQHGKLNGIIHAAGITRDGLMRDKDTVSLMQVLAAKVGGTVNLDRATAKLGLDFVLLCSSVSGAFGNPGQADYAAGNAFMDAYATQRNQPSATRWLSINWPYWRNGGMQIPSKQLQVLAQDYGVHPLESEQGFAALYAAFASQAAQVVVMAGERQRLLKQVKAPTFEAAEPAQPAATEVTSATSADLKTYLRETLAHVLQMQPHQLDDHASFDRYGVDSVMTLEIVDALSKRLGSLPNTLLLEVTTLDELTEWVLREKADQVVRQFQQTITTETNAAIVNEPFALTESQHALWLLHQIYPDLSAYHLPMAFTVEDLNVEALQQAIDHMVDQFPHLRLQLNAAQDPPLQRITDVKPKLEVLYSEDPIKQAHVAAKTSFQLDSAPLIRFQVFRNSLDLLLITAHHILLDGRSMALLAEALVKAYLHFSKHQGQTLPLVSANFADYAAKEQRYLDHSPQAQQDLAFWQEHLRGAEATIALPQLSQKVQHSFACDVLECVIDVERHAKVQQCTSHWHITPATFYLGCFQLLLHRYSSQADMVIGLPHMGRVNAADMRALGYFAGMVPLRVQLERTASLSAFFRNLQSTMMACLEHGGYPLPNLMRDINQDQGSTTLFEVTFSFQNFVRQTVSNTSGFQLVPEIRQMGDHPFGMEMYPEGAGLRAALLYHPERFERELVQHMLADFVALIDQITAHESARLGAVQLITPALSKPMHTQQVKPIHRLIEAQAKQTPDALAYRHGDHDFTYRQMMNAANSLARQLRQRDIKAGDAIAILWDRDANHLMAVLAIWKLNAIYLPLDARAPMARNLEIIADAKPALVLTTSPIKNELPEEVPCFVPDTMSCNDTPPINAPVAPQDAAYLLYTSGSTGKPKGVVVEHAALAQHCALAADAYTLSEKDTVLQFSGHYLDASLEQMLPILTRGGCMLMRGSELWSMDRFIEACNAHSMTVVDLPPLYLAEVIEALQDDAHRLQQIPHTWIVGGEALPNATIARFQNSPLKHTRLINAYGPTEAVITATMADVTTHDVQQPVPIGQALKDRSVYLLDPWLRPVPDGVMGELYIGGNLARGYLHQAQLTAASWLPDPFAGLKGARMYRTGDRVYRKDGQLIFAGRFDRQVQVRGYRVELGEVEKIIEQQAQVRQAVVVKERNLLLAWVLDPTGVIDSAALRDKLAHQLPSHMLPAQVIAVPEFPMNAAGKINVKALPRLSSEEPQELPQTPTQKALATLWCELLGVPQVDLQQDFFSLGGHSLHLLKLGDAIKHAFEQRVPLDQLLSNATIATQAALIDAINEPQAEETLQCLREGNGTALYLFPAIGGNLLPYQDLLHELEFDGPIYGLSDQNPHATSIADIAKPFTQAILDQQQAKAPILMGWSMGGLLAIEVSQQLQRAGLTPRLTLLLETYTPQTLGEIDRVLFGELPKAQVPRAAFAWDRLKRDEAFAVHDESEAQFIERLANALQGEAHPTPQDALQQQFQRFKAYFEAIQAYQPKTLDAPAALYIGEDVAHADAYRGWRSLLAQCADPIRLKGDHHSILQGNATPLSKALRKVTKPSLATHKHPSS